jgi:ABC transporter DrrB family efflux protein
MPDTLAAARARIGGLAADSIVLARRNLAHVRQTPEKLIDVTVQPLMFVLLFAVVFGGVIHIPSGSYREYLVGGVLVQTVAFGIVGPAMSIATDLTEGIVDRFRTLPIAPASFLVGHVIAELAAAMVGIAVMLLAGVAVGWRVESGPAQALAALALLALFALAMLWLGLLIGVSVRTPDAVTGIAFSVLFPLTFVSNAFVPAGGLPDWLRTVAEWNPISVMAAAVRTLFGNPTALPPDAAWPLQHPVVTAVAWSLAILLTAAPLASRGFRRRTAV